MPEFKKIDISEAVKDELTEIDVEFEAYCSQCGNGICHNINVDKRYRGLSYKSCHTINIDLCDKCKSSYEKEISELEKRVSYLEEQLDAAKNFV